MSLFYWIHSLMYQNPPRSTTLMNRAEERKVESSAASAGAFLHRLPEDTENEDKSRNTAGRNTTATEITHNTNKHQMCPFK